MGLGGLRFGMDTVKKRKIPCSLFGIELRLLRLPVRSLVVTPSELSLLPKIYCHVYPGNVTVNNGFQI
jgi:hypothetical protein